MKLGVASDSLLSEPGTDLPVEKIVRPSGPTVEISDEYKNETCRNKPGSGTRQFSKQYAHSYNVRLWATRTLLESHIKEEWGVGVEIKKIAELCQSSSGSHPAPQESNTNKNGNKANNSPMKKARNSGDHEQHIAMREDIVVAVVGTVFKQQPEKPSVLQELVEDNPMVPVEPKTRYISDKDVILLEDETSRVHLVPTPGCGMTIDGLVNGIIVAVKGKPTINGKFEIQDVLYATPKPSTWPEIRKSDVEMVFVSGLLVGQSKTHLAKLDLLFDYLEGLSGCPDEHENSLKMKTRLFILGDSFGVKELEDGEKADKDDKTEVAKKLDQILDQLSQTMDVFILPGENDPSEPMFPQTALHRCIFPISSKRKSFHSIGNPTRVKIPIGSVEKKPKSSKNQSLDVIMTSGQSVKDAMKNTEIDNCLEMSQKLLQWGHLCPTAPDTLALHPGIEEDIFVLKSLPNLFIVGNQDKFGVREWKNTQIITVPKFSESGMAVIFDKEMNIVPLNIKMI